MCFVLQDSLSVAASPGPEHKTVNITLIFGHHLRSGHSMEVGDFHT